MSEPENEYPPEREPQADADEREVEWPTEKDDPKNEPAEPWAKRS